MCIVLSLVASWPTIFFAYFGNNFLQMTNVLFDSSWGEGLPKFTTQPYHNTKSYYQELLSCYVAQNNELQVRGPIDLRIFISGITTT